MMSTSIMKRAADSPVVSESGPLSKKSNVTTVVVTKWILGNDKTATWLTFDREHLSAL